MAHRYLIVLILVLFSCSEIGVEKESHADEAVMSEPVFSSNGLNISVHEDRLIMRDPYREKKLMSLDLPVDRIALSSTTQLIYFQALDALEHVIACPWLDFVSDEEIQERRAQGHVLDITKGAGLDLERIISIDPDVFLYDPRESEFIPRLEEADVFCLPFMEYLETEAATRASWLELVGLLCDKRTKARDLTESIRNKYDLLKQVNTDNRPKVLFGSYYQGVWSAAGGGSLIAGMIEHAGGDLIVDGEAKASIDLDPEQFFTLLQEADFIGMIQQGEITRKAWLELDPRMEEQMIEDKVIFYCNTLEADYFGKGMLEPHIMLKELTEIFSGEQEVTSYFQIAE